MRSLLLHLHFITAMLLLSVASPLFAFTYDFKPQIAQAQTAQDRKAEAYRLLEEANSQYSKGQFQKALESAEQALSIYREIGLGEATPQEVRRLERDSLFRIGSTYLKLGQYDQILKVFRQILAIDRELGDHHQPKNTLFVSELIEEASSQFSTAELDVNFQEANSQLRERQYQKALELFKLALSLYQEIGVSEATPQEVRRLERDTLFRIGEVYGKLGQYDQILKVFRQILAINRELGDRCQEQDTLFTISSVYGVLGQYDQVLEGLEKIQAINRELDKPCGIYLLYDISDIYQRLGQPEKALKIWEQALAIYRKLGDRKQEKRTLFVISRLYQQQRQYEQALAALQKALSMNLEIADRSEQRATLIRIGEIYEQQGQYEQALDSYQQALTLSRKPSNPFGAISTIMSLSRVYQRLGQYEQAIESYQQALTAGRSVGNHYFKYIQEPYILMSLSQVYRQLGQDNQAREFYQQALAIGTEPEHREPSMRALNDWGAVQTKKGQFQEALETFEKALAISREVTQNLDNICTSAQPNSQNLGIAKVYPPKLAQAGSKCVSPMDQSGLEGAETLIFKNLGFVYRKLGQPEKSRESYEQALKYYQQELARLKENNFNSLVEDQLKIPRKIAQIYEILGEHNLAREFYRQAEKLEFIVHAEVIRTSGSLGNFASGIVLTEDDTSPPR